MSVNFVTSLYNINRDKFDNKISFDQYKEWFAKTMKIQSPMTIFVEEDLVEFVKHHRGDRPTEIITQKLTEIPYYHLKDTLETIFRSDSFRAKMANPERIECQTSLYPIIMYSKFPWVCHAARKNSFNCSSFFWIDAGLSRFFGDIDLDRPYPSESANKLLESIQDKILIQMSMSHYPDLVYALLLGKSYLWDSRSFVMGGFWGGGRAAISDLCELVHKMMEDMIKDHMFNNEQLVLAYLSKLYPTLFHVFQNHSQIHKQYQIIQELSK